MKLPEVKYAIPAETLTATIAALEFAQTRAEQDAAALLAAAWLAGADAQGFTSRLGRERLEQVGKAAKLVDFYLSL